MRILEEVDAFFGWDETSDETLDETDDSFFNFRESRKFGTSVFSSDLGEICYGSYHWAKNNHLE